LILLSEKHLEIAIGFRLLCKSSIDVIVNLGNLV
jgi:hypothetical protein